ncbi:hypothetical protein [Candidatus Caldatribacterium saccharofermentans]|uniref:hypothetical protein n=1 Tax=Candidatus Caldatribacterium saccharofermentans TaxID=1454753 RepID=UPI003D07BAAB
MVPAIGQRGQGESTWLFRDALTHFAIVLFIGGLVTEGLLSERVASLALIAFVLFRAVGRAIGGVTKLVYYLFMVPFYLSLAVFIILRVGWKEVLQGQWRAIVPVILRLWLTGFETVIVNILKLLGKGYLPPSLVVLFIVLLVICRAVGLNIGSVFVYHTIFSLAAPFFTLAVFLVILSSKMSARETFAVVIALVALFLMVEGLYLMVYGAFSPPREGGS